MKILIGFASIVTKMNKKWKFSRLKDRLGMLGMVVVCLLIQNLSFCWSLNDEGMGLV